MCDFFIVDLYHKLEGTGFVETRLTFPPGMYIDIHHLTDVDGSHDEQPKYLLAPKV